MQDDPSGINNDRARVTAVEDGKAVLAAGPSRTPIHVALEDLPDGAGEVGTWVVLDTQMQPPLVLSIDAERTAAERSR